jgi:type II secretory pathway pseudopilin PulG
MKKASKGYTIIEVMIVFAVSGILLISAIAVLNGQQSENQFNQSMQDISSKIKSIASEINSGVSSEYSNKDCIVTPNPPNKPVITLQDSAVGTTRESGGNENCLLLGRAIQIAPDQSTMYIYSVVGTRTQWIGGADTGDFAESYDQATPTPTIDADGTTFLLTEAYDIQYGAKVTSSAVKDSNGNINNNWDLVGLYSSLSGNAASAGQGATSIVTVGYPYSGAITTAKTSAVKNCIMITGSCASATEIKRWRICFTSADGKWTSQLTIDSTPSGLKSLTQIKCVALT